MKKNTLKVMVIAVFAMLLLSPLVQAYESSDYSITIPEKYEKEVEDGVVSFINEDNKTFIAIVKISEENVNEEDFYTEDVLNSMNKAANEYFDTIIIPSLEKDENGNDTGIKYGYPSGENAMITTFTKNNYKCIDISRGIVLVDSKNSHEGGENRDEVFALRYIYTIQNGKLYGIVGFTKEVSDFEKIVKTLTFKTPKAEESKTEESKDEIKKEEQKDEVKEQVKQEEKNKKDNTPKTGTVDLIYYAAGIMIIAGIGIIKIKNTID